MDENLQINVWNHVKPNDKPRFIDVYSFYAWFFSTSRLAKKHLVNLVTAKQTHGVINFWLTTGIDRRWAPPDELRWLEFPVWVNLGHTLHCH